MAVDRASARLQQGNDQVLVARAVPELFDAVVPDISEVEISGHVVATHEHIAAVVDDHGFSGSEQG